MGMWRRTAQVQGAVPHRSARMRSLAGQSARLLTHVDRLTVLSARETVARCKHCVRKLCITCQSEYDPNNGVSRTGYKSRNDAQVDSELGTKYRQDEENAYEER